MFFVKYLFIDSFLDHSSFVKHNQHQRCYKMIYNISIFGDIDFLANGSWQLLWILSEFWVKKVFFGKSRHNFEVHYQIYAR